MEPSQPPSGNSGGQRKVLTKQQITSPGKKVASMANERAPLAVSAAQMKRSPENMALEAADGPRGSQGGVSSENSLFNKHYNKELKLCEDEIPMVLCELNESALAYLNREQFENALLLLQKAHGVLDVVDLSGSQRDQNIALQLFHNMAMCYQKQGQLDECALCLETTLDHLGSDYTSLKNQSFGMRLYKLRMEAKLRLQFCAILSQLHRHKEAFEQAQEGIKIAHLIIRDSIAVCRLFSRRQDFQANFGELQSIDKNDSISISDTNGSKTRSRAGSRLKRADGSPNKIRSSIDDVSKSSYPFEDDEELGKNLQDIDNQSHQSVGQYQTKLSFYNNLEDSMSILEKTSKKLLPIYKEVLEKISVIEKKKEAGKKLFDQFEIQSPNDSSEEENTAKQATGTGKPKNKKAPGAVRRDGQPPLKKGKGNNVDLRHILGFLNQTEWIQNLNIGNIMQIAPVKLEDLYQIRRNEECLTRENFLEVISFLIVGYFCASTEIRFIIQLKDEINKFDSFKIDQKTKESELWHTISLEIACSFLPSDCPLLNHILLSYQKHHSPSQTAIPEDKVTEEKLRVIKPLYGIDNSKFQPIIRELTDAHIDLDLSNIKPAQPTVTKMLKGIYMNHLMTEDILLNQSVSKSVDGSAQQASKKVSPTKKLQNYQMAKLLKLEKIMSQFSKEIGIDKKQILLMMLGGDKNQAQQLNDVSLSRPKSTQDNFSQRHGIDSVNTGIAAKVAYNNLEENQQDNDANTTVISNNSQKSVNKSSSQQNWLSKKSPQNQNFLESRNREPTANRSSGNNASGHSALSDDGATKIQDLTEQSNKNPQIKSQRQMVGKNIGGNDKRIYDSESSQRDITFINDLQNSKNHDKSFNEQLDEKSKFVLNSNETNASQQHNISMGAIQTGNHQGGSVRQSSKRMDNSNQVRGKIQRPRSSKGYRASANGQISSQSTNQQMAGLNMHHLSAHHLPSGAFSHNVSQSNNIHNNQGIQNIQRTKSEERALKSQGGTRQPLTKQRQKTADRSVGGVNHMASHTAHNFHKDEINRSNKNTALASLNSQIQSQSSTQLPSAQVTSGLSKLSKKQLQQIQQQSQIQNQSKNHQSLGNLSKQNMKLNYDDLKKFLMNEYNAAQAQQILAQHAQQIQNSQSQSNFNNLNNFFGQGDGNGGKGTGQQKSKKQVLAQSHSQNPNFQNENDMIHFHTNNRELINFSGKEENSDILPHAVDQHHHHTGPSGNSSSFQNSVGALSSQQKKAKQILAQARKTSANNGGADPKSQIPNVQLVGNLMRQDQSQSALISATSQNQQYSVSSSLNPNTRQSSANNTSSATQLTKSNNKSMVSNTIASSKNSLSKPGQISSQMQQSINQIQSHKVHGEAFREQNSKSAMGQKTSQSLLVPNQNANNALMQNQNGGGSIKRREKGRLIMQEWLSKSGQPNAPAAANNSQNTSVNLSVQQQQQQNLNQINEQHSIDSQGFTGGNKKFIQQQMGLNSAQLSLTKQQQQQLQQIQMSKQISQTQINSAKDKPISSQEARRKSQPI